MQMDNWAYDISKNVISQGEIKDLDVINQSIELILTTLLGERFFNVSFGSDLQLKIFDNINKNSGEQIIDDVIEAIKRWEDRIIILEDDVKLIISSDSNYMILIIPYIIRRLNIKSRFQKKIYI
jgi:phage baseplate assembly protein W